MAVPKNASLAAKPKTRRRKSTSSSVRTKKKRTTKRRRGMSDGPLSGNNFSVLTKSLVEAGCGALVASVVNKATERQKPAIRVAINVAIPIALQKVVKKPMVSAGAAGVATINIAKIVMPNSRFLNDYDMDNVMNDLNALEDADGLSRWGFANPRRIVQSRYFPNALRRGAQGVICP